MMATQKSLLSTSIAVITLAAVTTFAYSNAAEAKPRGSRGNPEMQFERLDVSEDGFLDLDEMLSPALNHSERRFNRKDADDSGTLTFDEYATGRRMIDLSDIAEDIVACVIDVQAETGDDNIMVPSADKFAAPADKFATFDTSGDDLLDLTEVQAAVTDKVTEGFTTGDVDADGLLTLEEFTAMKEKGKATRRAVKGCIDELSGDDVL